SRGPWSGSRSTTSRSAARSSSPCALRTATRSTSSSSRPSRADSSTQPFGNGSSARRMPTRSSRTSSARSNRTPRARKDALMLALADTVRPLVAILLAGSALAQNPAPAKPDLSKDKVLYCVGYAHLDTQWRWDYPETIGKFLKATLDDNFDRFEKHPGYVFNF